MEAVAQKTAHRAATSKPAASYVFAQRKAVESQSAGRVQASLKVSSATDPAEKEANDTAKKVMRMPAPHDVDVHHGGGGEVHRKAAVDEKEEAHGGPAVHGGKGGHDIHLRRGTGSSGGDDSDQQKLHASLISPYVARFQNTGIMGGSGTLQRAGDKPGTVPKDIHAEIQSNMAGGSPLPLTLRKFMEPRFKADFSKVKIHTNDKAAKLSARLNAHAFVLGQHIFFGKGRYQPDSHAGRELLAHELTHTIQQGAAVQKKDKEEIAHSAPHGAAVQRMEAAAHGLTFAVPQGSAVQRKENAKVRQKSPGMVQRLGISDALDYFADKANIIPGFRMFTLILGVNPINMSTVDRTGANVLRAFLEFIPGGGLFTQALDAYGLIDKIAAFASDQLKALGMTGSAIKAAVMQFLDSLSWTDILHLGDVWDRAKKIFTDPIDKILDFGKGLLLGILGLIKDAILAPLAKLAQGTKGYDLLCAVMGKDPITGVAVPQTPEVLIGGFMKLIGEDEIWANMQKANAIPRVFAWFKGAMADLIGFVMQIPALFVAALKSLEVSDIIVLPRAFMKVASVFGNFALKFITWAGHVIWNLLEIIFDVVSPGALTYIKKTGAALKSILKNPLPFVRNLVKAAKLGFENFAKNFGTHLKTGLFDWLTGALPGVYIPKAFSLQELVKFVLSVLGISWANIRAKLVKVVGEPAVKAMEFGFDIVVTLVKQGPAAAWEKIKDQLANLKDMVIGGITDFVVDSIVQKAVPKLISMFIPGAGFISAILSIYDTVMVFVNKLAKIVQAVKAFVDSIVAIAGGAIEAAANKVESTLAGLLSLAISFLAGFLGLGNVAAKIMGVIEKVRATVDKAIDWLINWIVTAAKKLFAKAKSGVQALLQWWKKKAPVTGADEEHTLQFDGEGDDAQVMVHSAEAKTAQVFITGFGPTPEQSSKVAALMVPIDKYKKTIAAAQKKAPPDESTIAAADKSLTDAFNALGTYLSTLVSAGKDMGTEKNPIPIDYPKRRAAAYPIIYLGPKTDKFIDQDFLKEAAGQSGAAKVAASLASNVKGLSGESGFKTWQKNGAKIKTVRADGGPDQELTEGGPKVGLSPQFASLAPGRVLIYDEKAGTGGGGKINDRLAPFGFKAKKQGFDGDHVMERQLGGPDDYINLWPLPMGENRASGSILKSITFPPSGMTLHEARAKTKGDKPLHVLLKTTKEV